MQHRHHVPHLQEPQQIQQFHTCTITTNFIIIQHLNDYYKAGPGTVRDIVVRVCQHQQSVYSLSSQCATMLRLVGVQGGRLLPRSTHAPLTGKAVNVMSAAITACHAQQPLQRVR